MDGNQDNQEVAACLQRIRVLRQLQQQAQNPRLWVRPVLSARDELGEFTLLVSQLRDDPSAHRKYMRLTPAEFDFLLGLVRQDITKQTTNMRRPIPPEERLALTLR